MESNATLSIIRQSRQDCIFFSRVAGGGELARVKDKKRHLVTGTLGEIGDRVRSRTLYFCNPKEFWRHRAIVITLSKRQDDFFSSPFFRPLLPLSSLFLCKKETLDLGREKECKLDPRVDSSIVRYDSPKNTSAEAKIMTHHLERNMIENEELLQQQKNPVRRLKNRSATCLSQETFKKFPHHALFSLRKRKKKATRCHIYIIDYSHFYFSLLI